MSLTRLARPEILALKAYESARSLVSSEAEAQGPRIYLDANESPFGEDRINRYPEPQPRELVERMESLYGVSGRQLVIGRGSDEAIDLLVRTFCRPGADGILICPPTYGVYEIAAQIQGARVERVPLRFDAQGPVLDEEGIASKLADPTIKLVFLCSPNNPTGTAFDPAALERVSRLAGERALVVVDEAYAEFSDRESMIGRLRSLPNLVVLRTLSKAWGLAGARCGVAIAAPELIALLHKVRAPYPLPLPAVRTVLAATDADARERLAANVSRIRAARSNLAARLRELRGAREILESQANFVLVRFERSEPVMARAREAGIILRDRTREPGLEGCVRITLGSDSENDAVLRALAEVAG
jgi:histidinol-phosphate aminotransferase